MENLLNMSMNELIEKLEAKGLHNIARKVAVIGEKVLYEVVYYTYRIEYNGANLTIEEVLGNLVYARTEEALINVLKEVAFIMSELEEEEAVAKIEEATADLKSQYKEIVKQIEECKHCKSLVSFLIERKVALKHEILKLELNL